MTDTPVAPPDEVKQQAQPIEMLSTQQKAELLPQHYFNLISNRTSKWVQPALIFTEDNLMVIRRYVNKVRSLPATKAEIEAITNFAVLGVDVQPLHDFYQELRRHVFEWRTIERETKKLGIQLDNFATEMVANGETLLAAMTATAAYARADARARDLEGRLDLKPVPLLDEERFEVASSISEHLQYLSKSIDSTVQRINDVKVRAVGFADVIGDTLLPRANGLVRSTSKKVGQEKITALNQKIDELDIRIADRKRSYDANVGFAFTGALLGPLGLIITGGTFGAKAEAIRKEKDEFVRRRRTAAEELETLVPALASFERVRTMMRDLQFRLADVEEAAKNLEDVWRQLKVFAETSLERAGQIKLDSQLRTFVLDFGNIIRPWRSIKDISHELSRLFNKALKSEIKED